MRVTFAKRFLVLLAVVALVGGPWAQAMAQGALHHCAKAAATVSAGADDAAPCDMDANKADAGRTMSTGCAQDCLAQLNLVMPADDLRFERPRLVFEPGAAIAIDGRTPAPELSPPIASI